MSINIKVEPGQQIEICGKRYETTGELRKPNNACEYWLSETATHVYYGLCSNPRLILRPLPVRKVPTDQDAAVWPRRKCWVKDDIRAAWSIDNSWALLAVRADGDLFSDKQFLVMSLPTGRISSFRFCEIEVEE